METGEDVLIRRAKAGDSDAFCRLAQTYERRVYLLALHFCRSPADAEDLSQEVWLKAFRHLESFRGDASFYTWLRHILVNTFLNHRRAAAATHDGERKQLKMETLDAADNHNGFGNHTHAAAADLVEQHVLVGRVMKALGELTPQQRLIFLLKHREGLTYQEIAEAFGCSAGSVKKSLFRTVLKLRASLGVEVETTEGVPVAAGERS